MDCLLEKYAKTPFYLRFHNFKDTMKTLNIKDIADNWIRKYLS